jgi:hypothetical protein
MNKIDTVFNQIALHASLAIHKDLRLLPFVDWKAR